MLLFRADGHNTEKHFKFELEPVIETRADLKKASEQQLREWKLFVRNGNNKGIGFFLNFD
jgi:hypothetical protein